LLDPLKFDRGSDKQNWKKYYQLCKSHDWQAQKSRDIAQQQQQDWFALWVGQMARIAKPGAPVIIKSTGIRFCNNTKVWGGVEKGWWKEDINKYNWDVDPDSLEYGKDQILKHPYHVFMQKKKVDK
jgi:hypothetical protein